MTFQASRALRPFVCSSCRARLHTSVNRRLATFSAINEPDIYDVVTIGGGPVGLAFLTALKASPVTSHLRTALLETQDLEKAGQWTLSTEEYSNRASSLTPSSVDFLEDIGAWNHVDHARTQPYDQMQVWDGANDAQILFDWTSEASAYNTTPRIVATMTENANLTRGLLARISELDGDDRSSLFSNTTVSFIENGRDVPDDINLATWPVLSRSSNDSTSNPSKIAARLLVGADGANSPVRHYAGISSNGWDYGRHGVVATLRIAPNVDAQSSPSLSNHLQQFTTAYQRFLPALGGPIALLPLPDNRASPVWSTTPRNAAYLKSVTEESLLALINAAFRLPMADLVYLSNLATRTPSSSEIHSHAEELTWRLQHTPLPQHLPPLVTAIQPKTLASFPLRLRHSSTYISPRVALIGDAAHTIHPLAGQGLNLGLADAKALADTLAFAVEHGQDLGDILTLEKYNRSRWTANAKVAGACDALEKVYGIEGTLGGYMRGLGMKALDSVVGRGLKGWIMRQAEG